MKAPIERDDIRVGDLIRWEDSDTDHANEWRVTSGYEYKPVGRYYLLDRPTPPVELPTKPTLGWVDGREVRHTLAFWDGSEYADEVSNVEITTSIERDDITAFTPAVAVPKAALDELRANAKGTFTVSAFWEAIDTFLAAIDEATR